MVIRWCPLPGITEGSQRLQIHTHTRTHARVNVVCVLVLFIHIFGLCNFNLCLFVAQLKIHRDSDT